MSFLDPFVRVTHCCVVDDLHDTSLFKIFLVDASEFQENVGSNEVPTSLILNSGSQTHDCLYIFTIMTLLESLISTKKVVSDSRYRTLGLSPYILCLYIVLQKIFIGIESLDISNRILDFCYLLYICFHGSSYIIHSHNHVCFKI